MAQASRVSSTASVLGDTLDRLADALAHAQLDAVAAGVEDIEMRVRDFRDATAEAAAAGMSVSAVEVAPLTRALARCRRLGASLTLLARPFAPLPDAPHGYGPVGQPLPASGEGTSLTARV